MLQEALVEKAGISVTHMSHIEMGNTKLSLLVVVKIAEERVQKVLDFYTAEQLYVLVEILEALKVSPDRHVG